MPSSRQTRPQPAWRSTPVTVDRWRVYVPEEDVSAGGGCRRQICSRRDAVPQNAVAAAMERLLRAFDDHGGGACAVNAGPQLLQKGLQVHDLRFPGSVGNGGDALGTDGGQHGVFRGPHAGDAQNDLGPGEAGGGAVQAAALLPDTGTQGPQGGQVQVDGPGTDGAAAGVRQLRLTAAGQNGSQKHHRRAHAAHKPVRYVPAGQGGGIHLQVRAVPANGAAQVPQDVNGRVHVLQMGTALQNADVPAENTRCQNGQHAVFCPLYRQVAGQAASPFYHQAHMPPPFIAFSRYPMQGVGQGVTCRCS